MTTRPRRTVRRAVAIVLLGALTLTVPGASAQAPPFEDHLRAYSIVPPGQEGNVTALELASGDYGAHYDDQREMYASLINDDDVTEAELSDYFHSMQFGPDGAVERTYSPRAGVTVERDSFGIPHIYGDSIEDATFALGYVSAEDRMWQMDVFRHAARGTLAGFVGPDYIDMDIATRREGYTEAEVQEMFDSLDDRFGDTGATVQVGLQAYADGINAYIADLMLTPDQLPVEYAATGNPFPVHPEEWTVTDTLFLVILQLRSFGETAGTEMQNAGLFAHLAERLGKKAGRKVYNDIVFQNQPRSYTSIRPADGKFPSQDLGPVDWSSVAVPDQAEELAAQEASEQAMRNGLLKAMGFTKPASNALIVSGDLSATGNPLQIGAPQVGYSVPQFFMDIDVHAPGIDFRGPAVPGASALIPLGRGRDYAWTLTTGYSDAVDVRAELLCEPDGGEVTQDSNNYMFEGDCLPMESREETFELKPPPTDPGPPTSETHTFYRTVHGPVSARGTVEGKPVAFAKERYFWMREVDSVPAFYRWNTEVEDIDDFAAAAEDFTMSFNALYVDHDHIGYFHVGKYPLRHTGVHPSLPVWGTGEWEWQGEVSFADQPKIVDPKQGWLVNWNNKPARSWDNMDGIKWGSIHRVELLADEMKRRIEDEGKLELSDLVDVIRTAATQDVRGLYLGPRMMKLLKKVTLKGNGVAARSEIKTWIAQGANRFNRDGDEFMDDSVAVAVFDQWYRNTVHRVFDDELGEDGYDKVAAEVFGSSMWFDFSSYLDTLFNKRTSGRLARNYCDDRDTKKKHESCRFQVIQAWRQTLHQLKKDQGADVSAWTAPAEWIHFDAQGAGSVEDIPWQNRGTHNQVIEVLSDGG